jgi:hypothetical protein
MAIKQSEAIIVWGLYEKHAGEHSKLVGVFSSVDKARECALIQPLLISSWRRRDVGYGRLIWMAEAVDRACDETEVFYFTVEEIEIDRLVEVS